MKGERAPGTCFPRVLFAFLWNIKFKSKTYTFPACPHF